MTEEEEKEVLDRIENDSFDYVFVHHHSFDEINDEKFHILRREYLSARKKLANYINYED